MKKIFNTTLIAFAMILLAHLNVSAALVPADTGDRAKETTREEASSSVLGLDLVASTQTVSGNYVGVEEQNRMFELLLAGTDPTEELVELCKMGCKRDLKPDKIGAYVGWLVKEKEANIQTKNKVFWLTPFHWACKNDHVEIVRALLVEDGNTEARDASGKGLLQLACENGCIGVVKVLFAAGFSMEGRYSGGGTLLHSACKGGNAEVVRILLGKEVDIHMKDGSGLTPLHSACEGGSVEVVRILSDLGMDREARSEFNFRPLHYACMYNKVEVVKFLLAAGVDVTAKDKRGRASLEIAIEDRYTEIVALLQEAEKKQQAQAGAEES